MKKTWESLPIRANVVLIASDPKTGREVERVYGHNIITSAGKVLVARMLMDDSGFDTGLTYCEVGEGSTTPTIQDTALETPTKREAVVKKVRTSNSVQFRTFFAAADVSVLIKEIGLFGHSTATGTIGTGEMFNHALVTFDNTSGTKDLTVVVEVTFG